MKSYGWVVLIGLLCGCIQTADVDNQGDNATLGVWEPHTAAASSSSLTVSTTLTVISTTSSTTESSTSTTITPLNESVSDCVRNAGYDPEGMIFMYRNGCGRKMTSRVKVAAHNSGVNIVGVDIGLLKGGEIDVLECFLGEYLEVHPEFNRCPQLVCERNGKTKRLDINNPRWMDVKNFAMDCKNSQYL